MTGIDFLKCELCKKEKPYFCEYVTKGFDIYKHHPICRDCMKKVLGNITPSKKAKIYIWQNEICMVEDQCMHCGKETHPSKFHSFLFYNVPHSYKNRWYNFCPECAEKDFQKLIMIFNI